MSFFKSPAVKKNTNKTKQKSNTKGPRPKLLFADLIREKDSAQSHTRQLLLLCFPCVDGHVALTVLGRVAGYGWCKGLRLRGSLCAVGRLLRSSDTTDTGRQLRCALASWLLKETVVAPCGPQWITFKGQPCTKFLCDAVVLLSDASPREDLWFHALEDRPAGETVIHGGGGKGKGLGEGFSSPGEETFNMPGERGTVKNTSPDPKEPMRPNPRFPDEVRNPFGQMVTCSFRLRWSG